MYKKMHFLYMITFSCIKTLHDKIKLKKPILKKTFPTSLQNKNTEGCCFKCPPNREGKFRKVIMQPKGSSQIIAPSTILSLMRGRQHYAAIASLHVPG